MAVPEPHQPLQSRIFLENHETIDSIDTDGTEPELTELTLSLDRSDRSEGIRGDQRGLPCPQDMSYVLRCPKWTYVDMI